MKCSKTKIASAYIDDELGEKDKASFEAHAHGCPACSARLSAFRDLQRGFAGSVRHPAPFGFSTRVAASIAEQKPGRTAFPVLVRFAEVVIILLMMTVGVLSGGFLAGGVQGQRMANVASSFSLEVFEAAPPDSLGGVYLAMTEANDEK